MSTIGIRINPDGTTADVTDTADPLDTVFRTAVDVAAQWSKPANYPVDTAIPVVGDMVLFACLVAECGDPNPFGDAVAERFGVPGLVTHGPVFLVQMSIDSDDPVTFFGKLADDVGPVVAEVIGRERAHTPA